jgi:hypothetical protein
MDKVFMDSGDILGCGIDVFGRQMAVFCERRSFLVHCGDGRKAVCWHWSHTTPVPQKEKILEMNVQPYPLRGQHHLPAFMWHLRSKDGFDLVNGHKTVAGKFLTTGTHGVFVVGEEGLSTDPWGAKVVHIPAELRTLGVSFPLGRASGLPPSAHVSYVSPSGSVLIATEEVRLGYVSAFEVRGGRASKLFEMPGNLCGVHPLGLAIIVSGQPRYDEVWEGSKRVFFTYQGIRRAWTRLGDYRASAMCCRFEDAWGRVWEFSKRGIDDVRVGTASTEVEVRSP